jgi:hypothetical protein
LLKTILIHVCTPAITFFGIYVADWVKGQMKKQSVLVIMQFLFKIQKGAPLFGVTLP